MLEIDISCLKRCRMDEAIGAVVKSINNINNRFRMLLRYLMIVNNNTRIAQLGSM